MQEHARRWSLERVLVLGAIVVGVVAGSYGMASAASGSGSSGSSAAAPSGRPWGHQRSDETLLAGDALSKVTAAAKAKLPSATVVRVETDADGNAAYEAHLVKADGTPATVYVNKQFEVVSVESGMPGPPPGRQQSSSSGASA